MAYPPPFREFEYLLRVGKAELLGKRCFQVRFEKLAMPAVPEHVVHVDPPEGSVVLPTACAKLLPWDVRRRQWRFARTADLARQRIRVVDDRSPPIVEIVSRYSLFILHRTRN
jgi:hypothetical protein